MSVGILERKRPTFGDNIKITFKEWGERVWTGFIWYKIGSSGGLL
jgi:hypothetical protein